MRRREFIAGLGGAAAWPVVARAQQADRMRRIGVLMYQDESDPEAKVRLAGLTQGLSKLGWTDGRNLRIEVRLAAGSVERMRMFAKELVDLQCDVILTNSTPATAALQHETHTIPIIFAPVSDPVDTGFVASLPRPGGNLTGFINVEAGMGSKWLELLREIAPSIKRVAIMFNPDTAPGGGSYFLPSMEAAAHSLGVALIVTPVHSDAEIKTAITSLGREPGGGLVVTSDGFTIVHRASIISLTAENHVPAIYWNSAFAKDGGLLSYGPDPVDIFRRSASYVDRILGGTKTADLPVEVPIKFELVVNLKTVNALGLSAPQTLLATADEVIQ
jgi:putative tryptophan/tyrosine transport system substrate-binding protein